MCHQMYKALEHPDSIRFVFMTSRSGSDKITCQLFHSRLSDNFPYVALSYAWRDAATEYFYSRDVAGQPKQTSIDVE